MKTKYIRKYISKFCPLLLAAAITAGSASAATTIISQNNSFADSANNNNGISFMIESGFFSQNQFLDSITLFSSTQNFTNYYLNVYADAGTGTPNFSTGDNLDFLGSSTTTISLDTAVTPSNTPLTWTFSGITLERDTSIFAVFSTTATAGTLNQARLRLVSNGTFDYDNISAANSNRIANGVVDTNVNNDNRYSLQVTAVPEPSTALLGGLGLLALLRRRRA